MLHRIIKFPKAYSLITRTYTAQKPLGQWATVPYRLQQLTSEGAKHSEPALRVPSCLAYPEKFGHNVSCPCPSVPSVPSVHLPCECTEIQHLKTEITKLNYVVTYILCFSMINSLTLFSVVTTKTN